MMAGNFNPLMQVIILDNFLFLVISRIECFFFFGFQQQQQGNMFSSPMFPSSNGHATVPMNQVFINNHFL